MPERKMFKEVLECMYTQFLFEEVAFLRAYSFEVFNRTG
jgi:hypothetical protein